MMPIATRFLCFEDTSSRGCSSRKSRVRRLLLRGVSEQRIEALGDLAQTKPGRVLEHPGVRDLGGHEATSTLPCATAS